MELLLDTANLEDIAKNNEYFQITGVTTNPSILCREEQAFYDIYDKIRKIIGPDKQLHVQVTGHTCEEMLKEADAIVDRIGENTFIKIPAITEGMKAMKILKSQARHITATAILTPQQAFLAGMAGADYVAPYINRMAVLNIDPFQTIERIRKLFDNQKMDTKILGASFRNTQQIMKVYEAGADAATVSAEFLNEMCSNAVVDGWISRFDSDWEGLYGDKRIYEL